MIVNKIVQSNEVYGAETGYWIPSRGRVEPLGATYIVRFLGTLVVATRDVISEQGVILVQIWCDEAQFRSASCNTLAVDGSQHGSYHWS
jgi:hypothetical protein